MNLALFDRVLGLRWLASRYFFRRFRRYLPPTHRPAHTFVVGQSGSGKSEALKLLALAEKTSSSWLTRGQLRRDQSLVVIDPHGDLAHQLAQQRCFDRVQHRHPDLIFLDPCLAIHQGRSPVLNPFELYGSQHSGQERDKAAQQLMGVLRSLTCKNDESLSTNMETLLYPCLSVLLSRSGSTLYDLLRFVDTGQNEDLVRLGLRAPNVAHRYFFRHSFNEPRFKPTRGAISTKIQSLLNSQAFAAFLSEPRSSVDLEAAINSGKSIVVSCAASQLGTQTMSAIGRFVIAMVLAVALNRGANIRRRRRIRLIVDEVQHFASDELITILTEARKYGLHLTLACQIVGQGMSPQLSKTVLGNTGLKILGDAGADSRRIMAKEMGIRVDDAGPLHTGQLLLRHRHEPPIRCRLTAAHIDQRQTMRSARWRAVKQDQIRRYYPIRAGPDPPESTPADQDSNPILPNTFTDFDS